MSTRSYLIANLWLSIGLLLLVGQISGQKGGGSFSKFRQSIESIRASQQLPLAPIITPSRTSSSSSLEIIENKQLIQQVPKVLTNTQTSSINSNEIIINNQQEQQQQQQIIESASPEINHYGAVDGAPGVDFPAYQRIPLTKFSCEGKPFTPGLYADEETGCQAFHVCFDGRRESFLCGIGTIFNQATLNCDYWYSVVCAKSSLYYGSNVDFGKGRTDWHASANGALSRVNFESQIIETSKAAVLQQPRPLITTNLISQQVSSSSSTGQIQPVLPVGKTSFARYESSSSYGSSAGPIGGKSSRPKHLQAPNFFSPVGIGRAGQAPISNLDDGQQESKLKRVRVSMNSSSLNVDSSASGQATVNEVGKESDALWRPIFKSKTNQTPSNEKKEFPPLVPQTSSPQPTTIILATPTTTTTTTIAPESTGSPTIDSSQVANEAPKFDGITSSTLGPPGGTEINDNNSNIEREMTNKASERIVETSESPKDTTTTTTAPSSSTVTSSLVGAMMVVNDSSPEQAGPTTTEATPGTETADKSTSESDSKEESSSPTTTTGAPTTTVTESTSSSATDGSGSIETEARRRKRNNLKKKNIKTKNDKNKSN